MKGLSRLYNRFVLVLASLVSVMPQAVLPKRKSIRCQVLAIVLLLMPIIAKAEVLTVNVADSEGNTAVEFAAVSILSNDKQIAGGLTDIEGAIKLTVAKGSYVLKVNSVGYKPYSAHVNVTGNMAYKVNLETSAYAIDEVVVTAREGQGTTSTSLIDREAMQHLQPSSFTDLLELLPGNISKDPEMGSVNSANLRSAASVSDNYATGALGTSFVIDGVPVNTSADMTLSPDASRSDRSSVGRGVDMRTLSTDDIESVEVVRGIASVEYGEVTSGLINIKRKERAGALEARFKADSRSRLFYIGKGFNAADNWTVNLSADYLDSRIDPRNSRENFKRVTASARSIAKWNAGQIATSWTSSLNYTGTFERDRNDPDLTVNNTRDYYVSDKHSFSWNNLLNVTFNKQMFLRSLTLTTGLSYADELVCQEKTIAPSRVYPMPISVTPGPNYVDYLPMLYLAELDIDSRPLTAFVKGAARMRYAIGGVADNTLKAGMEWNMSKNYGDGNVYDPMRPLVAGNNTRPRPFNDIPAMHNFSAYVENVTSMSFDDWEMQLQLGVRETQLLHLDSRYALSGKPYLDPRANLKITFPAINIAGYPLVPEIAGGIGQHTKMPVAAYLYPDLRYTDYVQLNYYHNEEQYRTMNVMTFVEDLTNYDLKAARNLKSEIRADFTWRDNRLSVTLFREDMRDGFRATPQVHAYTYRQYDASGYDPYLQNAAPMVDNLPYKEVTKTVTIGHWDNKSRTKKEGVEFMFSSCRIPVIRTRVTVSGAYFKTTLCNSESLWYKPSVIVGGEELPYVGYYDDVDGSVYESFNTNFVFDTDIPRLKLNFSVAIQNMWFTSHQTMWRDGVPTHYMTATGEILPFTAESASDPYLQHLVRSYTDTSFDERRVPIATTFNIKATKKLWNDRIGLALYVNRLLSITPDYYLYGVLNRRYTSPYFGMEVNFKF